MGNQYLYRAFGEQTDVIAEGISDRFTWVEMQGYCRELRPDDTNSYYNRARVYALLDRRADALRDLERAIELDGRLREGARTDDDLSSLHSDPHFKSLTGTEEKRPGRRSVP